MEFTKQIKETILDYPEHLVIYSKPKMGKTDLVSRLPDCAIIDIEGGSKYVKGYTHVVKDPKGDPMETLKNLDKCLDWLIKERPYQYVAFDTMTELDDLSEIGGTYDFMNSPQGKKWNRIDDELIQKYPQLAAAKGQIIPHTSPLFLPITTMGEGYGYRWTRNNYSRYFEKMKICADRVIFICHIKDKFIDTKSGDQVQGREINLTGKLKGITTSFADTIAYLHRGKDGNTYLSFQAGEAVAEGTRRRGLSGKDILIGEWDKTQEDYSAVHWNLIYPDIK